MERGEDGTKTENFPTNSNPAAPSGSIPRWESWHIAVVVLVLFVCHYAIELLMVFGLKLNPKENWIVFLRSATISATTLFFLKRIFKFWFPSRTFAQVILVSTPSMKQIFLFTGFGVLWAGVITFLHGYFPPPAPTEIEKLFQDSMGFISGTIYAVAFAPFFEEVIFRGIFFSFFQRVSNSWVAFFLVSLLFTALHVPQILGYWFGIFSILSVSMLATAFRGFQGEITAAVIFHIAYNAAVLFNFWA